MVCPTCESPIPKFPSKKTRCKHCSNFYYARTKPRTKSRYIVNEKTKNEWERLEMLYSAHDLALLFGVKGERLPQLISDGKTIREGVWIILNECIAMQPENFSLHASIYRYMSDIVKSEGRDCTSLLELSLKSKLYDIQFSKVPLDVKIYTGGSSKCGNCTHLYGKILTIEDAFSLNLLPHKPCEITYCNAHYVGELKQNHESGNRHEADLKTTISIQNLIKISQKPKGIWSRVTGFLGF